MDMSTGAMGSLLPKLGGLLVGGYNLQTGVKEDVEFLEREMRSMNAALIKVAKVPRDQLSNQVIVWAEELRDLSYDMEDVVDNFLVCVEESESFANAIRDIKNRTQEVADRRDRYKVDDDAADKHKVDLRVVALYKDHKDIVGIEDARNKLTKRLGDGPKQQRHKLKIVSIVGPGGLGKTTLARAVYDRLQKQFEFEYKAFVPVGRNPEVKKVLRDILLEVDKSERMGDVVTLDEEQLIEKLRQLLENGRYFIVIDDIWDLKAWESIKCAFIDNKHGSRVITTTRILDVATNTGDIYKLEPLSQHLSEELFYTRLFGGKDKCLSDQPAEVSKNVLQKCGGVPLAIITIASLLAGKPMEDWSKVFNSIGFGSGDNNTDAGNTRKILLFSYYDLPPHLRSCLLHLSTYPEDYLINKNKLIWQWVAEGFVSEEPGVSLFETGERYFNELSNRSLIQPVEHKYKIYACRIHDMVLDMICVLSKEHNFVTILDSNEEHTPSQCNARRLAVQKRVVPLANISMPKLRSWYAIMCDPNVVPSLSNFQVLRVLAMEKCSFERDRPYTLEHIGRLPQLRYLSIESTNISNLPEEIGDLKYLQTLNLRGTLIKELPQRIGLLRKLKCLHADVYGDAGITVSNWIGNLTSLEELYLHTADESSIFVEELRKLTELRVLICELTARMDNCWKKTFVESLCNLRKIQVLEVRVELHEYWKGYEPSRQLRDLFISGGVRRLPAWINSSLLPNLSNLDVRVLDWREQDVANLWSLPKLTCLGGQCYYLILPRGMEFPDGAFPKLRSCRVWAPCRFLQGSMQSLEEIEINLDVRALKDAGTDFDFIGSLGNLPSLRKVDARFFVDHAYTSDYEKVRDALRKAIDTHPNSPTLTIPITGQFLDYESDEEEMDSEGIDDDDDDDEDDEESNHDDDNRPDPPNKRCRRNMPPQTMRKPAASGTSKVWQHFTFRAYCKHCSKDYAADSKKNGTSNLWNHLEKVHNIPKFSDVAVPRPAPRPPRPSVHRSDSQRMASTAPPPSHPGRSSWHEPPSHPGSSAWQEPPPSHPRSSSWQEPPPPHPGSSSWQEPPPPPSHPGSSAWHQPYPSHPGSSTWHQPYPSHPGSSSWQEPPPPHPGSSSWQEPPPPPSHPGSSAWHQPYSSHPRSSSWQEPPPSQPGSSA